MVMLFIVHNSNTTGPYKIESENHQQALETASINSLVYILLLIP